MTKVISQSGQGSIASDATADLETAITKTGCGKFNWMIILLTFPVAAVSVFVTGSMSYVIGTAAPDLRLTPSGKAWLQSAHYAGMIVSGYLWGFLSDAHGRKKLMVIGFLIDFFLNIGAGIFMSLPVILVFKFLSGFMVSGPYSIYMVYMAEVFSRQHRDAVAQFMGVFTSVSSILQCVIAMLLIPMELPDWVPFKSWQLFVMFGGLPSLICGLSCLFFYESPKFLVDKGKTEKALSVCRNIFTINTGKPQLSFPVKKIQTKSNEHVAKKLSCCSRILEELFVLVRTPFLLKTLMTNLIFIIMFSFQNNLRLWMPEMFRLLQHASDTEIDGLCPIIVSGRDDLTNSKNVIPKESVYIKMMIINSTTLLVNLLITIIVKCIRKKILLVVGVAVAGCFIFSVPWLSADIVLLPISIFIAIIESSSYAFLGAIVQVFPTHLRAKSISMALMLGRTMVVIGNFLLSNAMYSNCEDMFYTFGGGSLCIVIFLIFLSFTPYDDSKQSP